MPIPRDILDVERPKNTVVIVYGVNKDKYAVRQRVGCKRVNGKNIPLNGPTIGHIINGKYVPKNQNPNINLSKKKDNPEFNLDLKDWANIMLSNELFSGILEELKELYSEDDAHRIFAISILRVCYPGIKDYELKEYYDNSFLSELYPNISLSKNIVSEFFKNLGKFCNTIKKFMQITQGMAVLSLTYPMKESTRPL